MRLHIVGPANISIGHIDDTVRVRRRGAARVLNTIPFLCYGVNEIVMSPLKLRLFEQFSRMLLYSGLHGRENLDEAP